MILSMSEGNYVLVDGKKFYVQKGNKHMNAHTIYPENKLLIEEKELKSIEDIEGIDKFTERDI